MTDLQRTAGMSYKNDVYHVCDGSDHDNYESVTDEVMSATVVIKCSVLLP